jgi:hypothetical protein
VLLPGWNEIIFPVHIKFRTISPSYLYANAYNTFKVAEEGIPTAETPPM